jgi:hypothetical protein
LSIPTLKVSGGHVGDGVDDDEGDIARCEKRGVLVGHSVEKQYNAERIAVDDAAIDIVLVGGARLRHGDADGVFLA